MMWVVDHAIHVDGRVEIRAREVAALDEGVFGVLKPERSVTWQLLHPTQARIQKFSVSHGAFLEFNGNLIAMGDVIRSPALDRSPDGLEGRYPEVMVSGFFPQKGTT